MYGPIHLRRSAPTPSSAELDAQVKAFLKSGGKIDRVKGFSGVAPLPDRKEPERRAPKRRKASARHLERRTEIFRTYSDDAARLFSEGMLVSEISRELDISREWVDLCLDFKGIDRDMHKKKARAEKDEQVKQMRELAKERYTKRYAAQVMGMDYEAFHALAKSRGVRFRELA